VSVNEKKWLVMHMHVQLRIYLIVAIVLVIWLLHSMKLFRICMQLYIISITRSGCIIHVYHHIHTPGAP
jgi:hypothetical protein